MGAPTHQITQANLGGTAYLYTTNWDDLARETHEKIERTSDSATMFDQARTFDGAGNVTTANTTIPDGTDNQQFCYDDLNRLAWAGSAGTPPCTGTAITSGTLTGANYHQSFSYDALGRLTNGPLGAYSYADGAHVHAATSIGSGYTASYDAAGDMTCRAPSSSSTCDGTSSTGAQLGYDSQGQLTTWHSAQSDPSASTNFLYDGDGQRVARQVTQSGSTTTTVFVGKVEEVTTNGGATSTTTNYSANGNRIAEAVNGTVNYMGNDVLGSSSIALSPTGSATGQMLYAPYGTIRYASGAMPDDHAFTGQISDLSNGLDYYGARYYDPLAGQFVSADTELATGEGDVSGLSRYSYVEGDPETAIDPTGHRAYLGIGGECDIRGCTYGMSDPVGGVCYGTGCGGGSTPDTPTQYFGNYYEPGGGGYNPGWSGHGNISYTSSGWSGVAINTGQDDWLAEQARLAEARAAAHRQVVILINIAIGLDGTVIIEGSPFESVDEGYSIGDIGPITLHSKDDPNPLDVLMPGGTQTGQPGSGSGGRGGKRDGVREVPQEDVEGIFREA